MGTLGELGGALSPVLTICPSGAQAHQVPGHASPCGVLCWGGWGNCPLVIPKAGKVGGLLALLDHGPGDAAAGPAPSVLLSEELESTPHPSLAKAEQVTRRLGPATNTLGQLGPTGHRAILTPAPPPNPSAELSPSPSTAPPDSHALPLPAQVTRREQRLWQATVPPSPSPQLQPGLARVRPRSSPEREEPRGWGWGWGAGQGGGLHAEDWVCRQEGRCSKRQRGESRE